MADIIIVSACLAGISCRYDGKDNRIEEISQLTNSGRAIPVCPEVLGGLDTPRIPCEIIRTGNNPLIRNIEGRDMTGFFIAGAEKALAIAKAVGAATAILKSKSPSCGCGRIYDGTFSGKLTAGNGITVGLFLKNGINVLTEENFRNKKSMSLT